MNWKLDRSCSQVAKFYVYVHVYQHSQSYRYMNTSLFINSSGPLVTTEHLMIYDHEFDSHTLRLTAS